MKQQQIDEIILAYERHVYAEYLQSDISMQNCKVSNWPALNKETLSELLWAITIFARFGNVDLTDLVWSAWHTMMTYVPHNADQTDMVMMWDRKIQDGVPAHASPDFELWAVEAMALFVCYCNKLGEDEVLLMQKAVYMQPMQPHRVAHQKMFGFV